MFRKLLKYEWRANARLFWILSAAALGVALLGGAVLRTANYVVETATSNVVTALVVPGMYLLFFFCCLALVGYVAAVEIINLVRFYKSKFTDEGYLTFTLPVKANEIYLSTFVNILLWLLISGVIMVGCFLVMFTVGIGNTVKEWLEMPDFQYILDMLRTGIQSLRDEMAAMPGYGLNVALSTVITVLTPFYVITLMMGCLTLGSVLAQKHKILASIGIYYGASMVTSTVTSVFSGIISLGTTSLDRIYVSSNVTCALQIVLMIGVIIGGYFLSSHLMKNKLNLP